MRVICGQMRNGQVNERKNFCVVFFALSSFLVYVWQCKYQIYILQGNNLLDAIEDNQALTIITTDERAFYEVDSYCELIAMPVRSSL